MTKPLEFDPDAAAAPGSGLFGLPFAPADCRFVVLPIPFEATTSYGGGASRAPAAILAASRQVDLFDLDTGEPWRHGIAMLPIPEAIRRLDREAKRLAAPVIRAGGPGVPGGPGHHARLQRAARAVNAIGERVNAWVRARTDELLDDGKVPFVLGGDHSVPFGAIEAASARMTDLGILHVDAHADLRDAFEGFTWSHASIFHNVATRLPVKRIVQVGLRDVGGAERRLIDDSAGRIVAVTDSAVAARLADGQPWSAIVAEILAPLPERVWISFDIDGLDPSLCPHTGTPVPGGLSFQQAVQLVLAVARSGRQIVGADLDEVSPGPRGDEWDANVGARLLYKMIGAAALSLPDAHGPCTAIPTVVDTRSNHPPGGRQTSDECRNPP